MFKFRRNYNFVHLMIYYALLLTTVIGLFVIMTITTTTRDDNAGVNNSLVNAVDKVSDLAAANEREVREVGQRLTGTSQQVNNLAAYFQLDPAKYLTYSQTHAPADVFYYLPAEATQIFNGNPVLKKMVLTMSDSTTNFVATTQKPGGYQSKRPLDLAGQFSFNYTFVNNANLSTYGNLYLIYETTSLTRALKHLAHAAGLQLFVFSDSGTPMYQYQDGELKAAERQQTGRLVRQTLIDQSKSRDVLKASYRYHRAILSDGTQVVALTSRAFVRRHQLHQNLILLAEAVVIDLILLLGLWITFRSYRHRLSHMIRSMDQVGQGDLDVRLTVPQQAGDLHVLAAGINRMLDDINHYIYQIYHLQLEQKDANMKALQSQIQPHFLYNTLEYIRMYAVAESEPELADVVYAFASLLRNNTDQSATTTIAKEAGFTEKYIYLYQMRFPDQIAYGFQIDPALTDLKIPKFILQPIVENYFAHGIDYLRDNNFVDVKGWLDATGWVHLQVKDNGKGMSAAELTTIRQRISGAAPVPDSSGQRHTSIGMRNVFERLQGYFGEQAQLTIQTNQLGGITVELVFLKGVV